MAKYERATTHTYTSLAWLNAGQAVIFTLGLTAAMVLCVLDIRAGRQSVGSFVMINAMMVQLYQPLNFLGMIYREIKQSLIDIEAMFAILARPPEIEDTPGARPLQAQGGAVRFEDVRFSYDPGPRDPQGRLLRGAGRAHGGDRRPLGRRQVHHFAPAVPLLRRECRPHHH